MKKLEKNIGQISNTNPEVFEALMNEYFEKGDKETALYYKELFIAAYLKENYINHINSIRNENKKLSGEIESLKDSLEILDTSKRALSSSVREANKRIKKMQSDIKALKRKEKEIKNEITEMKKGIWQSVTDRVLKLFKS